MLTKQDVLYYGATERNFPEIHVGDKIELSLLVQDKNKERIQKFEGHVIGMRGQGASQTFKVRKIGEAGVGIEMTLPFHALVIQDIKLISRGIVRRAKLNYLRDKVGKKETKIKTRDIF